MSLVLRSLLISIGSLTLPLTLLSYLLLRLRRRQETFLEMFQQPDVAGPYMASRGRPIEPSAGELPSEYRARVKHECQEFCAREFFAEFGVWHFIWPGILASICTALVVIGLVSEAFGDSLAIGAPQPIIFALLGGLLFNMIALFKEYKNYDLEPVSLCWMAVRYLISLCIGALAESFFAPTIAGLGSFLLATFPFGVIQEFLRSRIPGLPASEDVAAKLSIIQGLDRQSADKVVDIGVRSIQQLAFSDPLRLLLASNLSPKVLIDWMDQALLYSYLESRFDILRSLGIRGAMEMPALTDAEANERDTKVLVTGLARRLDISEREFLNLIECLDSDSQVATLKQLWGVLGPDGVPRRPV